MARQAVGTDADPSESAHPSTSRPPPSGSLAPLELPNLSADPLVSVVVPTFNYGAFLEEAVRSAMGQTHEHLEVLICDDGSTDDTPQVAARLASDDPRVKVLRSDTNRGQADAFNRGVDAAQGEIVCFLDADDLFEAPKVAEVVRAFRDGSAGLVLHPMIVVTGAGEELQRIPSFTAFEQGWIAPRVLRRGGRWRWMPASGVSMRSEVARAIFPMPTEGFRTSADAFALVMAPLLTPVRCLDRVLGRYRRHGGNAYARATLDLEGSRKAIAIWDLTASAVNARLADLGHPAVSLDLRDNLKYRELRLQITLLEGTPGRRALPAYRELMRAYRSDDLFGVVQKVWAHALYGIALVLPVDRRATWLSRSLTVSKTKERIRRMIGKGSSA